MSFVPFKKIIARPLFKISSITIIIIVFQILIIMVFCNYAAIIFFTFNIHSPQWCWCRSWGRAVVSGSSASWMAVGIWALVWAWLHRHVFFYRRTWRWSV